MDIRPIGAARACYTGPITKGPCLSLDYARVAGISAINRRALTLVGRHSR